MRTTARRLTRRPVRTSTVALAGLLTLTALTACSAHPQDPLAQASARLEAGVPTVVQGVVLDTTEPHEGMAGDVGMLGSEVIYDNRTRCVTGEPASCGALVEQWPSALAARQRAHELRGSGPVVQHGDLVLQLSSQLGAAAALQYARALG